MVAKPIYEKKSYQFVHDLLSDTILLKKGKIEVPDLEGPHLPQNLSPNPRGNKISTNISLFQVTGYIVIWYFIVNSLYCEFTFTFFFQFVSGLRERIVDIKIFFE